MARCDEGYLCDVCGGEVDAIIDSDLYLRYILGEVPLEQLHRCPERHIRCNPAVAQYIVDTAFPLVIDDGMFGKRHFDAEFVSSEEQRITRAWRRLQSIPTLGLTIAEYPLDITPDDSPEERP